MIGVLSENSKVLNFIFFLINRQRRWGKQKKKGPLGLFHYQNLRVEISGIFFNLIKKKKFTNNL